MIEIEDILEVMGREAKKVCENVIPQNRPNATDSKLSQFIVVSLPYSVVNKMLGEDDDWWLDLTVVFEIYVADQKGARNPKRAHLNTMRDLRSSLRSLFPIVDRNLGIKITRPKTVIPSASDGDGYHYSRIQARMTTMV
jgi:hypothetical protein